MIALRHLNPGSSLLRQVARQTLFGRTLSLLSAGIVVAVGLIGIRAARYELLSDFSTHATHPTLPATGILQAATTTTVSSRNHDRIVAWWRRGPRHIPIVLIHGSGAARDQLADEGEILSEFGFSVLLLDLPGSGESTGKVDWGRTARLALADAVSFVEREEPGTPVGLYGFSFGAMIAAQVAATDERIQAVALAGVPDSFDRIILAQYSKRGWLSAYPALWVTRFAGYTNDAPAPVDVVSSIRAVMVITGTEDRIVPFANSLRVFRAASDPKLLLSIESAHHGDYLKVMGRQKFASAITTFFEQNLTKPK